MIRRLKVKFALIISIILMLTFSVIFFINYSIQKNNIIKEQYDSLEYSLNNSTVSLPWESSSNPYSHLKIFVIEKIYETVRVVGYEKELDTAEREYLLKLSALTMTRSENSGELPSESLIYSKQYTSTGYKIAFLDMKYANEQMTSVINASLWGVAAAFVFVVSLTFILTFITISPVEKSYNQQKQLISDVSHELKTPLTVITANIDIIKSELEDVNLKHVKNIDYIKTEATRMNDLINNMLFLAKNDTEQSVEFIPIDLSLLIRECVLIFETVCFEKNLFLFPSVSDNQIINGNYSMIKQLIMILFDNAVKYSNPSGNIKVNLQTIDSRVVFSINNSGNTIPKNKIARLFDRFYRVDDSRSRNGGGYGLGLSILKKIADKHSAKINVTSDEVVGTTFYVSFKPFKFN